MKTRRRTTPKRRRSAQQWGPSIGRLRFIDLVDRGHVVRVGPMAAEPVPMIVNASGTALLLRSRVGHVFPRGTRPVRIDYTHAQGGHYTHKFTKRASARITPAGIVIAGITVKPYIEG